MVIARKIAYNVVASSVSKVLSTILALVSIGFITRYLGKEGFGNYATVLAFLSFFSAIADLGLYSISTREISRPGSDEGKIIGNIFTLRIIASASVLLIAPLVVMFFNYPIEVKKGILIIAVAFLFSSSYQVLNGVFQKNLAMDKVALSELTGKGVQLAVIIFAVKFNLGFGWLVASLLANMAVNLCLVFLWSRKYLKFKLQADFKYWKKFLKESLPMGAVAIITFAYFKMDTIMLSVMKTSSDVGIYNAAYKILENLTFFPAMIIGLILPIMAQNIFHDRKKFEYISNETFKFFVILIIPIVIGTIFMSDSIIQLVGGTGFAESADVLRILIFALAFVFFGNFFNAILIAGNMQKKLMFVLVFAAILNIVLNLVFIPKFSYFASATSSAVTELVVAGLTFFLAAKEIKYFPKMEKKLGIIFAGAGMVAFLVVFQKLNFFIIALGSVAIYFTGLWLFKVVKTSEITSLITKKGVKEFEYENLP